MKKICLLIISLLFFCFNSYSFVSARDISSISDWYIDNFESGVSVNKDSSLLITERITADCGNLPNKHGIFRVLPTITKTDKGDFKTPIELISITDFDGKPYKYETIKNRFSGAITWKIGDPDVTVTGKNNYEIVYSVKNAVRFNNQDFDELYWNLSGNFWDIDIDSFSAEITFSGQVTKQNATVDYYTGYLGSKDKKLADYQWTGDSKIYFKSVSPLLRGQGITASIIFPKNIFTPYQFTFLEKYGSYFWYLLLIIPIAVFAYVFSMWKKYGRDPKAKYPISPEFGIPENITPIQMGMVKYSGRWSDKFITASIVDLAVKRFLTIEESDKKILLFNLKDIMLRRNLQNDSSSLTGTERILLDKLFANDKELVHLSDLKNKFFKEVKDIKKSAEEDAVEKGWVVKNGLAYSMYFLTAGIMLSIFSFITIAFLPELFLSLFLSGVILLAFSFIMPKRTQAGADLLFKIKGFELYMKKAEDYRQQFYEKENIFDKFLPYAIIFGITGLWIKKMQDIYGQDYYNNYHPVWIVGTFPSKFDINSFTKELNSITSSISASTSTSSGAGGAGGAGGGGGGGGGGGW